MYVHNPDTGARLLLGSGNFKVPAYLPGDVSSSFELGYLKVNQIENKRVDDVWFIAIVYGNYTLLYGRQDNIDQVSYDSFSILTGAERVPRSDWLSWLRSWGSDLQEVLVPGEVLKTITEIQEVKGRDFGETLSNLVQKYKSLEASLEQVRTAAQVRLVRTEPTMREMKEEVESMLSRIQPGEDIRITGYFGSSFLPQISSLIEKGHRVMLITRKKSQLDKECKDATGRLASKAPKVVRTHNTAHARLFIVGESEAIISSADLKSDSLDTNFEAGVWTDNKVIVSDAKRFFDSIWAEAASFQR